ncbi:hypothetical protein, partial [Actinosynnema sp. NPDC023926]|uniref:hypothetical protein n=1 Tax=Actinosynnema sp. NPDC023926 TaxID=3157196 RepID=UPI0034031238
MVKATSGGTSHTERTWVARTAAQTAATSPAHDTELRQRVGNPSETVASFALDRRIRRVGLNNPPVVTGANKGLGRETVRRFAAMG